MDSRPILYLIDGHALAYRMFYAMKYGNFTTSKGELTNATYGFSRTLLDIYEFYQPHYIAVTFDEGLSGRDEYFPDYKGTRLKMPEELASQFDRIHEIVDAFNIPRLTMANMEADDVLGTVTRQATSQGVGVHIATGDKDILQLLAENVRVQLPKRGDDDEVYDVETFKAKFDLEPDQLVDLKALMGDSSDNIPGVAGVGEKTATTLLQEYGSLQNIYDNLDSIKTRFRNKLIDGKDDAFISQRLATIMRDLPIELELDTCEARDFEFKPVDDIFAELEFKSLRERLRKVYKMLHPEWTFYDQAHAQIETVIVQDEATLQELVDTLNGASTIAFDTETTSIDQMTADLVGISLAIDGDTGYYIPVGHTPTGKNGQRDMFAEPLGDQLPLQKVVDALRPAMTNPDIDKVAHNAIYDMIVLRRYGIDVAPVSFDTMIAEWVSNPISRFLGLKGLVKQRLGIEMTDIEALIGSGKNQKTMNLVDIEAAAPYAAADATMTYRLIEPLRESLSENDKLHHLFQTMEMPIVPVVANMQHKGVTLDVSFLKDMSQRLDVTLKDLEQEIFDNSGGYGEFNINSPKQLNEVLFDSLKLPVEGLKKTSLGYSTNATTLDILKDKHSIINMIIEYRELSKLKSTYVDSLPELVNPETGRLHTSYNQTGAATGRFSSSNPNLQNIPIRTELGREVRRAFVAPEGYVLLAVDYSQIELRVMAHMSEDETLIDAFKQGLDIHSATAATVNGIDPDDVTYEQRSFAKRVNFGLMYGMGAFRLARDSELTLAESEKFIQTYFERLPGVERYIENTKAFVWENGYTETLYGRRREYPAIMAGIKNRHTAAEERAAINMPIQGTAADILKQSMLDLRNNLEQSALDAMMILQVHDELVLEVKADELDSVKTLVVETMESAFPDGKPLRVPLKANASYGENWRDMVDMD